MLMGNLEAFLFSMEGERDRMVCKRCFLDLFRSACVLSFWEECKIL